MVNDEPASGVVLDPALGDREDAAEPATGGVCQALGLRPRGLNGIGKKLDPKRLGLGDLEVRAIDSLRSSRHRLRGHGAGLLELADHLYRHARVEADVAFAIPVPPR